MKNARLPMITKPWLALILFLALLPFVAMAEATPALDERLLDAVQRADMALAKTLLDKGANVNAKRLM